MGTLRLIGRGLSDTLEHLLPFTLWSLTWWAATLLILPGPPYTVGLFAVTDPRRAVNPADYREVFGLARRNVRRGWALAGLTFPIAAVLVRDLSYYGSRESMFSALILFWTVGLGFALAVTFSAFSLVALTDAAALPAIKRAALITAARPLRAAVIVAVLWVVVQAGWFLVVPAVMFVPALVAAVVNRWVLDALGIDVPDPLAPTEERVHEELAHQDAAGRQGKRPGRRR